MTDKNPTIRERLSVVETEVKYLNTNFSEFKQECNKNFTEIDTRLGAYNETLVALSTSIENKLQGSFSGKEKAAIWIAVIGGIVSIINIAMQVFWG